MMNDFSIVPPHLAVKAMRDNGYKNMAYALAELIDNSIQAGAKWVEVLLAEKYELVSQRAMSRIHQIAVLDNGSGMDATVLRMALQFGNGTRLESGKRTGMGRFGMGLPSASISQCRRVEIWSWQGDITQAMYTYLDLDDIEKQHTREIPIPQRKEIPRIWLDNSALMHNQATGSGTLVVWSQIDRGNWSTSKSIIKNSEFVVGRMYRHFLYNQKVRITMKSIKVGIDPRTQNMVLEGVTDDERADFVEHVIQPNDPLHLMPYHHLQAPWNREPMFAPFGDYADCKMQIKDEHGNPHDVFIRTSVARAEARDGDLAGAKEHGKHAARNLGISIVRAGRELDMDEGQVNQYDPVERWWGMEISFPPALDEVFGVTNNKQAAVKLRELLNNKIDTDVNNMFPEQTPLVPLLKHVKIALSKMREELIKQTTGRRQKPTQPSLGEGASNAAIKERTKQGHVGGSDAGVLKPYGKRIAEIQELLVARGAQEAEAKEKAEAIVVSDQRVKIDSRYLETSAFFSLRDVSGVSFLTLNTNHPLYTYFFELTEKSGTLSDAERIRRMRDAIEVLLSSWARMEDEALIKPAYKAELLRIREEWGAFARAFLNQLNEHRQ